MSPRRRGRRRPTLAADARNRAWRAFLQGLAIDVAVGTAALVLTITSSAEAWQGWVAVGASFGRTIASSAASYVMRRFLDSSRIPTPLPPAPVPGPNDDEGEPVFVNVAADDPPHEAPVEVALAQPPVARNPRRRRR